MDLLEGIGLEFQETMTGSLDIGAGSVPMRLDARIAVADLKRFLDVADHRAALDGTLDLEPLGGALPIHDGHFELFTTDLKSGAWQLVYEFRITDESGQPYFFQGQKVIRRDASGLEVTEDMTRLAVTLHRGVDRDAPVHGTGVLVFNLRDTPALLASMKVPGATYPWQDVAARMSFFSFVYGVLREEYLRSKCCAYDTHYENLVLDGVASADGTETTFFLVSGAHDKGFPWGDGELFWDVLLLVGDGEGRFRRYCITDRVLRGMRIDVERGVYAYQGPMFALESGTSASFSEMQSGGSNLRPCDVELQIELDAHRHGAVLVPFQVDHKNARKMPSDKLSELHDLLPSAHPLGALITPYAISVRSGWLRIREEGSAPRELRIEPDRTFGEAERSVLRNLREPTLLYGYFCAIQPKARTSIVQLETRTLRDERELWAKDRLDAFLGTVVSRFASLSMTVTAETVDSSLSQGDRRGRLTRVGEPLLEVNNDHFPTADFQRRIVLVKDAAGAIYRALEEDMTLMRLEPVHSEREATVAVIRDESKAHALDEVLRITDFDRLVEERLAASGKPRSDFRIVIKPNFMFAYDKRDPSTYTDPELVAQMARRLRRRGFSRIVVAEAQSTYGEYFDRRSVKEMADYLGFTGRDEEGPLYDVVDLTEDATLKRYFGPHLGEHPVSPTWQGADFRISFAKNKTHPYAFYTLCVKNIYGALPLGNKFKEYHCARDIYHTTMEFLHAFPVHYGLVDAYLSADGPFGVFADPAPNPTQTILGGADIIAVDWVGASKMGIDPMISKYMRLGVEEFGKPRIRLVGDANPYRPWLNVPVALALFTKHGLDAEYHFGNLLYMVSAQMDGTHFKHKDRSSAVRMLRQLTRPLRKTFFIRTGEHPTVANRFASWLLTQIGY